MVLSSAREIEAIRSSCGTGFLIVTPGVRLPGATEDDQKRVLTPRDAIHVGADYLVIGRPILQAADQRTRVLPQDNWLVLIPDLHAGYISWKEFQDNQRRLHENAQAAGPAHLGKDRLYCKAW